MKKYSAGILVYRFNQTGALEVLLAHPGGPFWTNKDDGVWSIPKGEYSSEEKPFDAAKREFEEEIGQKVPVGKLIDLGELNRQDGKNIKVWAIQANIDSQKVHSNSFEIEWPPKSGQYQNFPEVDRADWFSLRLAANKLSTGQPIFLSRLNNYLKQSPQNSEN